MRRATGPAPDRAPGTAQLAGVDTDAFELAGRAARVLAERTGTPRHDAVVVLGTALGPAVDLLVDGPLPDPPVDLTDVPGFPAFTGHGHAAVAHSLTVGGRPTLVVAGRLHLYEGRTPAQCAHLVRTAVAMGARTVVLTNAAGGIRADLVPGSVVLIADHLNLTGRSPLEGVPADHRSGTPFVDLHRCWSPELRARARQADPALPSGVYAQLPGPHLETPAEIRMLATLGADLVGMSTVLEAIAARHLGADVLGLSVVTNVAAGLGDGALEVEGFGTPARAALPRLARVVRGVLALAAGGAAR